MKVQILAGRLDRVQALLEVASSCGGSREELKANPEEITELGLEPTASWRQWVMALRPLRPLFRTEASDLDVLLGDTEALRLDDVDLYLERLGVLTRRWTGLDPTGLLGLDEFTDAAVMKVNGLLSSHQEYGTATRVSNLLDSGADVARAGSVKQRLGATKNRLTSQDRWLCHYCGEREADVKCSAMLQGKKLLNVTYSGNTTTYHYSLKRDLVQRCPRCADLHVFLRSVGTWTWAAFGVFGALVIFYIFQKVEPGRDVNFFAFAIVTGIYLGITYVLLGMIPRGIAALLLTPRRERRYWNVKSSKGYKTLVSEGYSEIKKDYSRNAFDKAVNASK